MPFIYLQLVPRHAADSSDYFFSVYYPTISMLLHIMRHVRSIAKLSKPFSRYYFTTSRNVISSLIPIQTSGVHWLWLLRVDLIYESNVCVCFLFHCSLNLIVLNRQLLSSLGIQKKNAWGTLWCEHLCLQKHFGPLKKHRCHNKKRKHTHN